MDDPTIPGEAEGAPEHHGFTNRVVAAFLESNLSLILLVLSVALGLNALFTTPREEDPQIVVPMADIHVGFPGHSAEEVEQLVAAPLERLLFQIDGVENVYSMSRRDGALVTVRFFVGEDRERSLVKLKKRIDEHLDVAPEGAGFWLIKPVEIDDVPIVTLTLTSATAGSHTVRRVAEEMRERLAATPDVSRATIVGGESRVVYGYLDPERLHAYHLGPLEVARALRVSNSSTTAGSLTREDRESRVEAGRIVTSPEEFEGLVVGVYGDRPVFLRDVATVEDGPRELVSYVRHGWGPARGFETARGFPGGVLGARGPPPDAGHGSQPAVTLGLAKKKGTNAVQVADEILDRAEALRAEIVPDDVELIVTRNYGLTADGKVNELIEALVVAVFIVIVLLTFGLGWRESMVVAVAVPVVFGLTLFVNQLFGYTINRVTLFALILSLGLLVDDPIVDVENIARHFAIRGKATRAIVLEAVAEIRPPLITATLAVIVSFLPLFFITGMMGPYMQPMALNVPVAMLMSMVVAFTITPWLAYHALRRKYEHGGEGHGDPDDPEVLKESAVYRLFYPLLAPLLRSRAKAWMFLFVVAGLTAGAVGLAAVRKVPLKMLPFDNKNELMLKLDLDEGTTLERTDAAVRAIERHLATVAEVTDFVSYVGLASPMDFNGLVRHYYLRDGSNVAEIRLGLVDKKSRTQQSHAIGARLREELLPVVRKHNARLAVVEAPPGPPVLSTIVAEVRGGPRHDYDDLVAAAGIVRERLEREPGVVDADDSVEADRGRLRFVVDQEKAALHGISVEAVSRTVALALEGAVAGVVHAPAERQPLEIVLRLRRPLRSSAEALSAVHVAGADGVLIPLAELGRFDRISEGLTLYHKDLERIAYVFAETLGRPPADVILDVEADRIDAQTGLPGRVADTAPRPVDERTFFDNGGGIAWSTAAGIDVSFSGEGEWDITLDVFRDLGLAFAAALLGIYVILVAQTGSFGVPMVVMLAIPLTFLGIMPGFQLLNAVAASGGPVYFTATGMIGMIALAGIVTRDSVILVDFIHLQQARGRSLFDSIMASRVVRLRPILLTAGTALLSALPITIDPIFSGLAWALIFGLVASTVFTLFVVPLAYWMIYAHRLGETAPPAPRKSRSTEMEPAPEEGAAEDLAATADPLLPDDLP